MVGNPVSPAPVRNKGILQNPAGISPVGFQQDSRKISGVSKRDPCDVVELDMSVRLSSLYIHTCIIRGSSALPLIVV